MPRKQKHYHYIYKTINLLSGKYYIGMHSTNNLEDGYMGSGKRLRYSINKYGKENHKVKILEFFNSREELKKREEEIVNLNEIAKIDCMNLKVGGYGGFPPNVNIFRTGKTYEELYGKEKAQEIREKQRQCMLGKNTGFHTQEHIDKRAKSNTGKKRTDESKEKIRQSLLGKKHTLERRANQSKAQQGKDQSANFGSPRYGKDNPAYIPISLEQENEIIKLHTVEFLSAKVISKIVNINNGKVLKLLRDRDKYIEYTKLNRTRKQHESTKDTRIYII